MITMSKGNKKITKRKLPATNNKVLVRTGSLHIFKKYRQPLIKFWSILVPVCGTVRKIKMTNQKPENLKIPWWSDYVHEM